MFIRAQKSLPSLLFLKSDANREDNVTYKRRVGKFRAKNAGAANVAASASVNTKPAPLPLGVNKKNKTSFDSTLCDHSPPSFDFNNPEYKYSFLNHDPYETHESVPRRKSSFQRLRHMISQPIMIDTSSHKNNGGGGVSAPVSGTGTPRRSKSQRFKEMISHPLKSMHHHHYQADGEDEPLSFTTGNSKPNKKPVDSDGSSGAVTPRSPDPQQQLHDETDAEGSSKLGRLFKHRHHSGSPASGVVAEAPDSLARENDDSLAIKAQSIKLSSSAPHSRTSSRYEPKKSPKPSGEEESDSGGGAKKFSRLRSRSRSQGLRSRSASQSGDDGGSKKSSLPPNRFLPPNLQQENYQLSARYSTHKITLSRYIGKGATATVKTIHANDGTKEVYACKVYHRKSPVPNQTQAEYYAKLAEEYEIAKLLGGHRNVIQTKELGLDSSDAWCCVMEYCDMGDLFGLIESWKAENKKMPRAERNCLFKQLLMGVAYIHSQGVAHRDIKPENLLLTSKGELKITDFGVSTIIINDPKGEAAKGEATKSEAAGAVRLSHGLCGSTPYIAPEIFADGENPSSEGYDARKADTWSCAVVYANLAFNGGLFPKADMDDPGYARYVQELDKYWALEDGLQKYLDQQNESEFSSSHTQTPEDGHSPIATPQRVKTIDTVVEEHHEPEQGEAVVTRESYLFINSKDCLDQPLFFFNEFGESGKRLVARMLNPDPIKRPLIGDLVTTSGYIRKIGMCIGPDPKEVSKQNSQIDVTNLSSIRKLRTDHVVKNHSHKPPAKPQKQVMPMGQFKDPYR